MNRSILFQCVLCASFLVGLSMNSEAQRLSTFQFFPGSSRCDHVIQMMLRHGVNNSFNRSDTCSLLHHSPFAGINIPVNELGDLQIVQVNQLPAEGTSCGPKFSVIVMNQSNREVCNFHVSAVAVFGHITPNSPNQTVSVAKINPGEALEITLSLPIEAFSMGNRNGEVLGFERLIVVVDSYDELLETDEANNIKAFNASEIAIVTAVVGQSAISVIESSSNAPSTAMRIESSPSRTVSNSISNVSGDVSVDALDLDHPTPESLRSAIQQVNAPQNVPQNGLQNAPQVAPQVSQQAGPQTAPQVAPQTAPQNAPQTAPQLAPQTAPQVAPQNAPQPSPQVAPGQTAPAN